MTLARSSDVHASPVSPLFSSAEEYAATKAKILAAQRRFLDRFPEGELVIVDAPHYMEPVIPDRIAEEVMEVADRP